HRITSMQALTYSASVRRAGDHLLLPSFPTRRSSDLGHHFLAIRTLGQRTKIDVRGLIKPYRPAIAEQYGRVRKIGVRENRVHVRSEEHTSELQSLAYLVCRLLLEKKNIAIHQR